VRIREAVECGMGGVGTAASVGEAETAPGSAWGIDTLAGHGDKDSERILETVA